MMDKAKQQFYFSVIAQLLLPLLPLILELWLAHKISDQSLSIATAMYSISVGVSSKNLVILGISIAVTVVFSTFFGALAACPTLDIFIKPPAFFTIFCFIIVHTIERYKRHVIKKELFAEFGESNDHA